MIYITVPDLNDSLSLITLDNQTYLIGFTYNMLKDYWTFGLYDVAQNPLLTGVKIVPNYNILTPYKDPLLPPGEFAALSSLANIGRQDFNNGVAQFIYLEKDEIVSLGS
jgi:hypothetical protein